MRSEIIRIRFFSASLFRFSMEFCRPSSNDGEERMNREMRTDQEGKKAREEDAELGQGSRAIRICVVVVLRETVY